MKKFISVSALVVCGLLCHAETARHVPDVKSLVAPERIYGGSDYSCAVAYPFTMGGCNACVPDGSQPAYTGGPLIPVWKSCETWNPDDKCMADSGFAGTLCRKTSHDCNSFLQHYTDSACMTLHATYIDDCGFQQDDTTELPQSGVNCEGITFEIL